MLTKLIKKQEGNALILVGLAFLGLLSITGLVLDGGVLYMTKSHLQKTANAAVLSGAQELLESEAGVNAIANEVLLKHNEQGTLQNLLINMEKRVDIELTKEVPLTFSSLFGSETAPVSVTAAAELGIMGIGLNVAPIGIDANTDLELGQTRTLKVGPGSSTTGFFGILDLPRKDEANAAMAYEMNLKYGWDEKLTVGDEVLTQTGTVAGGTKKGVKYLVDQCPEWKRGDPVIKDCGRSILIPRYIVNPNKTDFVTIVGFAFFFVVGEGKEPQSIEGIFYRDTGKGFVSTGHDVKDTGAYVIRLTR